MKEESILEVLMYLFDGYLPKGKFEGIDRTQLMKKLYNAGLTQDQIGNVLIWLDSLPYIDETIYQSLKTSSLRIYTEDECEKLSKECRGLLLFLEQLGILDSMSRELVIEKAMSKQYLFITFLQLKKIIFQVLVNFPAQTKLLAWLHRWIFQPVEGPYH